jgi:hypothetical protein
VLILLFAPGFTVGQAFLIKAALILFPDTTPELLPEHCWLT